jgi:hypothetical protein
VSADADDRLTPDPGEEPAAQEVRLGEHRVLPVTRTGRGGRRTVGVYEATPRGVRWHPAVDVQRLAERGQVLGALVVLALAVTSVARARAQGRPAGADRVVVERRGPRGSKRVVVHRTAPRWRRAGRR